MPRSDRGGTRQAGIASYFATIAPLDLRGYRCRSISIR
ncbi:hypothetical protein BSLA_01f3454 [Burkholderia stabilis]|nr:hypothetical protein BSLA_01f3454 [Burkholderia stabilis]